MLMSHSRAIVERPYLAAGPRPAPHYEHTEIGFNYRLSNLLAAPGRGQLQSLGAKVERRRAIRREYMNALVGYPGIDFLSEASYGRSNAWLTCITVDPQRLGMTRDDIRLHLEARNIESRPVWKPMHLQPVFRSCRVRRGDVSQRLFEQGLCLPSGSALTPAEQALVIEAVEELCGPRAGAAGRMIHG
jgi:dTDP-4-amino-4,6-dideoxygalactose transaminase